MRFRDLAFSFMAAACLPSIAAEPIKSHRIDREINLPDEAYNYSRYELPFHFLEHCDALDNTPADNPITDAGATLGRVLFYDKSLSANGSKSCASCHQQRNAFTDSDQFSEGYLGQRVDRNSMSLIDLRYYKPNKFFWDERAEGLEAQVLQPIQNPVEMGRSLEGLVRQLQCDPLYVELFVAAFGDEQVTSKRVAKALAQFIRSIVSYRSLYDQGRVQVSDVRDPFPNFSDEQNRGKELFFGAARCATCHVMQVAPHPLATYRTDEHMNIEYESGADVEVFVDQLTMPGWSQTAFFWMAEPLVNGIDGNQSSSDGGVGKFDGKSSHFGAFKSPSLRNVELTAPYMHDGRFKTLEAVMEHYNWSVKPHANLDFRIADLPGRGLAFQQVDVDAIVAFMKTLTDRELIQDERFSDPFTAQ